MIPSNGQNNTQATEGNTLNGKLLIQNSDQSRFYSFSPIPITPLYLNELLLPQFEQEASSIRDEQAVDKISRTRSILCSDVGKHGKRSILTESVTSVGLMKSAANHQRKPQQSVCNKMHLTRVLASRAQPLRQSA